MAKKKLTIEDVLVPKEEIPYEVPENWCWTRWGFLGNFIAGTGFKPKYQGFNNLEIPFYKVGSLKNIDSDGYICIDDNTINEDMRIELKAKIIPENSILFAKVGEAIKLNRRALATKDCCIDNNTMSFQCNKNINYRYIYYWSKNIELYDYSNATTVPSIRKSDLEKIVVPLPPLVEQERIVNRIESLFEKVDKASELVVEAREGFEKRRAAILEKAISGELTRSWREENSVSDKWENIKFNDLGKLERGRSKHRPRNDERLFGGPYPFIQTGDIANTREYIYHHKQTLSEFGLEQSRLFPKGTLCITIAANIGDVAILTYDCCFPDSVVGFTPNDDVESKFILYYINLIKRDLEHYAPATAQKNINLAILGALDIPKPSIEEQRQIVKLLDKTLDNESKVEDLIDLDNNIYIIKKSILAKAFRGELGSNDLENESSIELLKVIL